MSTDRQDLFEEIVEFLKEYSESDMEDVNEDTQLLADIGFNSLDLMRIVNDAEDEFEIVIDDDDLKNIVTVGDVVDLIASKRGN